MGIETGRKHAAKEDMKVLISVECASREGVGGKMRKRWMESGETKKFRK